MLLILQSIHLSKQLALLSLHGKVASLNSGEGEIPSEAKQDCTLCNAHTQYPGINEVLLKMIYPSIINNYTPGIS